ncbi:hypothetical protein M8J77_010527 [Diaphorina citri]|nr:hypothetical protein M8J77_010527 [Diaphorina citri]
MRLTLLARRAIQIPFELPTHRRQVQSLYKRAVRNLEAYHSDIVDLRIEAVLLRARFDKHKDENDLVKIRALLAEGEKELFDTTHPSPIKFPTSPGGVAYEREPVIPDWVLDYWHPLERAQYPEYFKRREERKKEFLVWWEKQYGKPSSEGHGH